MEGRRDMGKPRGACDAWGLGDGKTLASNSQALSPADSQQMIVESRYSLDPPVSV